MVDEQVCLILVIIAKDAWLNVTQRWGIAGQDTGSCYDRHKNVEALSGD